MEDLAMIDSSLEVALSFEAPTLLIKRFCAENQISEVEAEERFHETKKFLVLCANNRCVSYSPSKSVDAMWHQFMLHSRDYFRFCNLIGGYIHHQPSEGPQPECYARTLEDMPKLFNQVNLTYWGEKEADCDGGSVSTCDCCP